MVTHIRQYFLLLKWQLLRLRTVIPIFAVMQVMTGVGFILGLSFMMPEIDPATALFFVTGGPTLVLVMVGLVMVPQMIAEDKQSGSLTYIWSLPVSRITYLLADLTVWIFSTLPGVVLALVAGSRYYGFELSVSWSVLPVAFMVSATASCMGYAIAHFVSKQQVIFMLTNFIVFSLFLFSPVSYPLERLPAWLQAVHAVLPITYMADLMRSALTGYTVDNAVQAFLVIGAWMLVSFAAVAIALQKRR